jgi:hypothetical protein
MTAGYRITPLGVPRDQTSALSGGEMGIDEGTLIALENATADQCSGADGCFAGAGG